MNASPLLFEIPQRFIEQVAAEEVVRYGAILKNAADGKIVAHLQQTGMFEQVLGHATSGLGQLVSNGANPLGVLSGVGTLVQNEQIKGRLDGLTGMVGNLQTLGLVTSIASVAGIGVTVASTAILHKRMGVIGEGVKDIQDKIGALPEIWEKQNISGVLSQLTTIMERLAEAPTRKSAADTRSKIEAVQEDLQENFNQLVDGAQSVLAFKVVDEGLLRHLLAALANSSAAQMRSLVWLDEVDTARQRSGVQIGKLLDLSMKMPADLLQDRPGLDADSASRIATDLADLRAVAASRPALCDRLVAGDVNGRDYIEAAEERDDAAVVMLASD